MAANQDPSPSSTPEPQNDGGSCSCGSGAGGPMKRTLVVAAMVVGLVVFYAAVGNKSNCCGGRTAPGSAACQPAVTPAIPAVATDAAKPVTSGLPKLLDLGADKCIPCKMMAPLLEELKTAYSGRLDVVFADVWKNPAEAKEYGIETIPTQIFFDAQGKELFRHEGFFAKDDILAKWKELGVDLSGKATEPPVSR